MRSYLFVAVIGCFGVFLTLACIAVAQETVPAETTSQGSAALLSTGVRCPTTDVIVFGASPQEQGLICSGAVRTLNQLGSCSIAQRRTIRIRIAETVRIPLGVTSVAFYDPSTDEITITNLVNAARLVHGTPYSIIPLFELYESFAAHELVHALMHPHLGTARNAATHEYPAYAVQLELWSFHARTIFIAATQAELSANEARSFLFSEELLFVNPYFFAARAFLHYSSSGDRCRVLSQLGSAPFVLEMPQHGGAW